MFSNISFQQGAGFLACAGCSCHIQYSSSSWTLIFCLSVVCVLYFIPVLWFGMIQLSTHKMKPGSSSMDHFLEPTWTRPVGHFCLPLHYSLPTAPSAGRVPSYSSHILPSFQSSPPKREKQHTASPPPMSLHMPNTPTGTWAKRSQHGQKPHCAVGL